MYKVSIENKGFFGPQNPMQMRIDVTAQAALSPSPPLAKDEIKDVKYIKTKAAVKHELKDVLLRVVKAKVVKAKVVKAKG